MLAEHAAHDLKHKNDLAKEKAIDVFETLDIQAAMCVLLPSPLCSCGYEL